MKRSIIRVESALLLLSVWLTSVSCVTINQPANSASANGTTSDSQNDPTTSTAKLSDDELDELLAPIALYPDPLLAQIIPASTFVDDIKEAQQKLKGSTDDNLIAKQDWDVSVKSVAHYPPVLKKMAENEDWMTTVGQAYINQPADITKSLQRLRAEASNVGNLVTTPQQEVIIKDDIIRIEPAQAEVIYVPEYNPETVYVEQAPEYVEEVPQEEGVSTGTAIAVGALAFGAGLAIGSWLNRDYDYYGDYGSGPYYHGWSGNSGWVSVNSAYVNTNINRNVYVNDSYRNINTNRNVVNHNVGNYRNDLNRNAGVRNQRVNNAGVDRQLKRQNGPNAGGPGRGPDRNPGGPGRNNLGDRGQQPRVNELDRNRGNSPNLGDRNNSGRNMDRGNSPNRGGGIQNQNQGGNRQRQNAAPRQQPQRSAPQRNSGGGGGGGGGRRRG